MSNTGQPPVCHPSRGRYSNQQCKSCYRLWYWAEHGVPLFEDKVRYGVSADELRALYLKQDGRCFICGIKLVPGKRGMHVDHYIGDLGPVVRGLLCGGCNVGIAQLRHDPAILRRAADYLSWEPRFPGEELSLGD